jgi:hypothetical protein
LRSWRSVFGQAPRASKICRSPDPHLHMGRAPNSGSLASPLYANNSPPGYAAAVVRHPLLTCRPLRVVQQRGYANAAGEEIVHQSAL